MKFIRKHLIHIRNIFLHLVTWAGVFAYPVVILNMPWDYIPTEIRIFDFLFTIGFFYLNAYYFVPKYLLNRKYLLFALLIGLGVFFYSRFASYTRSYLEEDKPKVVIKYQEQSDSQGIRRSYQIEQYHELEQHNRQWLRSNHPRAMNWGFIFTLAISTSFGLMVFHFKREQENKIAQNERLNSELSFLKSQINPHFLFNVLNNMYSLALKKSDNLPSVVLKLSEMMRYMLYDSEDKKVSLNQEIEYINNYIELQKMRLYDNCKIDFEIKGITEGKMLAPMLLIPFVENAFKHGVSHSEEAPINFLLEIKGQHLYFRSKNKIFKNQAKDKTGGIGLQNVRRRLELLYPKLHSFTHREVEGEYIVELEIRLTKDEMLNS